MTCTSRPTMATTLISTSRPTVIAARGSRGIGNFCRCIACLLGRRLIDAISPIVVGRRSSNYRFIARGWARYSYSMLFLWGIVIASTAIY